MRTRRKIYIILVRKLLASGQEDVDWIHLAQERDQSQALVNMVQKF